MLKRLLLLTLFFVIPVKAQVLSGHQEFVHYSDEQKEEFIVKVMEMMTELEDKYETASPTKQYQYALLLKQLKEILISNAYAAETNVTVFAEDLTQLLDPSAQVSNRCIYAGWVSRTVSVIDHRVGRRQVCQHPKFIRNGANTPEAKAYAKSSSCGQQNANTIACNPAIFGFKNQAQGSQFCVPSGPSHSENSSYACMQLSLGLKQEAGADPAEKRMEYLKKQFEGNPQLMNNLFGFIYKTCLCSVQDQEIINKDYLSRTRPHRTCLGLVNTIAETNHCVEFDTVKSSDMEMIKNIRKFTNDIAASKSGSQIDSDYKELLGTLKTRFSRDYARICGGDIPPEDDGKECNGECDFIDGKFTNCVFKSGDKTLEAPELQNPTKSEFSVTIEEEKYLCKIKEKEALNITCNLEASEDKAVLNISAPEGVNPELKATHWTPAQEGQGPIKEVAFGDAKEVSVKIEFEVDGRVESAECSVKNPKSKDIPKISIKTISSTDTTQELDTTTDPQEIDEGWKYVWTRTNSSSSEAKKTPQSEIVVQEDSTDETESETEDSEETKTEEAEGSKPEENKSEAQAPQSEGTLINNDQKTYSAPKEDKPYTVCVKLTNGQQESNEACETIAPIEEKPDLPVPPAATKPNVGGPQLPNFQPPMRRGTDFSRGGIL
ncbi:MAG: hypothetical protein WCY48_00800 [Candidatus Caldatribacteriota bacterium]